MNKHRNKIAPIAWFPKSYLTMHFNNDANLLRVMYQPTETNGSSFWLAATSIYKQTRSSTFRKLFLARDVIYSRLCYYASVRLSVRLSVTFVHWFRCKCLCLSATNRTIIKNLLTYLLIVVTGCDGSRISLHAWIDGCLCYLLTSPHPDRRMQRRRYHRPIG